MKFIQRILTSWKIVTVNGPYDHIRFRDNEKAAISSENNKNIAKLLELANNSEKMQSTRRSKKYLTKDTSMRLSHTCRES